MNRIRLFGAQPLLALLLWVLPGLAGAASTRVDDIERRLRGQPENALQALAPVVAAARGEERVQALILRGWLQLRVADEIAIEETALELDRLAGSENLPLAGAAAGLVRAGAWSRHKPLGRADRALSEAQHALPAATPAQVRLRFVAAQAAVRQSLGKVDEAVALYQQAVQLADKGGLLWRRAELRSSLAYTLVLARQHERAQQVNAEATQLADEAEDLHAQAIASNTAAIVFTALGQDDLVLQASRRANELAHIAGSKQLEVLTTANLADFYLRRGDNAIALDLARQALPLAREVHDLSSEAVALTNAGLALIGLGRHDEGARMVREALLLEERAGGLPGMANIQNEFGQALEKAGLLADAWAAFVEHRRLSSDLFQRQHQQAVLELQEGLDAERRQRELAALETDNGLKEAQLLSRELQQRLWGLGLLAGVLLLVVVAVLLRRMGHSNARLHSSNAQLKVASERDPLTGLANRRHFQAVMQQTAAEHFEGSLLLIDLDHFKRINDAHGHAMGDAVLVEVAQRLRAVLREEDLTVRWGGEEFLVVVRDMPADQVEALAERLLGALGSRPINHTTKGREPLRVTASVGFATFPLLPAREPLPWEKAIDVVDTALYLAKAHGRNRAYGVRALRPGAVAVAGDAASGLEHAWREGHAELAQLPGPVAAGVPA